MAIQPDSWIRERAQQDGMIEPFEESRPATAYSYGLSSYGYDARVADEFRIFTTVDNAIVDPKNFANESFVERQSKVCIIPPNSFVLARTVEYFRVPRDTRHLRGQIDLCALRYHRQCPPLEPEWDSRTLESLQHHAPAGAYLRPGGRLPVSL